MVPSITPVFQALSKYVAGVKLAGTASIAPLDTNWAIMSVPICVTSGVSVPATAV